MRKLIAPVTLFTGLALVGQAQAADKMPVKPGKNMDVTLYGQVNKAMLLVDDGKNDDVIITDNDISGTRFGIKAKGKVSDNFSAGAQVELEYQTWPSNDISIDSSTGNGTENNSDALAKRQLKAWFKTVGGKVTIGHGSVAADGIAEHDLSGTAIAGNSHMKAQGGDFAFYQTSGTPAYVSTTVGKVFDHLDGGRKDMLRYDSPDFAGVTISASAANENYSDLSIRYSGKFNGFKVKAGLAGTYEGSGSSTDNKISGSASVLMPFGLSVTLAGGTKEFDNATYEDGQFLYTKIGYQLKTMDLGSTSFSIDYGQYDDMTGAAASSTNYEGTAIGLQFVQKAKAINTEFYAAYRLYELEDDQSTTFDDISLFWAGARVKF